MKLSKKKYFKAESRLRMANLREAERLWQSKHKQFTDNLESLINFIKTDNVVEKTMRATYSLTGKPINQFVIFSGGELVWDSLNHSPKTFSRYIVLADTFVAADTFIAPNGKIKKISSQTTIGQRYFINDPDGYGSIGDVNNDALKNIASWER